MNVLLSIKPKYVKEILEGRKKFEFRKSIFKRKITNNLAWIYSSAPEKKIVANFRIGEILENTPENIWNMCKESAGIDEFGFFQYFAE